MSHTKEPWAIFEDDAKAIVTVAHPMLSLMTVGNDGLATMFSEADARRIVACVNACAGIETHELELMTGRMSIASQIKACDAIYATAEAKATRRSKFAHQRDELLAAAEAIEVNAEECMDFDDCTAMLVPIDDYHKLMDAIATAKGATRHAMGS